MLVGPNISVPQARKFSIVTRYFVVEMDPLSTTVSVIAVLQLSEVVKYIDSAAGATKERKRLREELRACETILQQVKDKADDLEESKAWSGTIKALKAQVRR